MAARRDPFDRYARGAAVYDLLSFERTLYRAPRRRGIDLLALDVGATVLDVGCGTGLSFPWLQAAVGESGRIVGVDTSAAMLAGAARRARLNGWPNVTLINARADRLVEGLRRSGIDPSAVHGVLIAYALSVMARWERSWRQIASLDPGTRVAVVDLSLARWPGAAFNPLWRLLCTLGGSDPSRRPDRLAAADLVGVRTESWLGGHVTIAAGEVGPIRADAQGSDSA
ncbi:MAG: methyltransferase domain-containing protein [Actinomycetota bacterium]|nr:methyltransferase domain-containing protein [Actinomycetota bacterium]MDQ6945163.1 methyltransferase domain-containing protein [Actinomycetota bacterium]